MADGPRSWLRGARRTLARMPSLRMTRVPDAPVLRPHDPWPGDPAHGVRILKGELELAGTVGRLVPGRLMDIAGSETLRAYAHSFVWLRDLRALGSDNARTRARALVQEWIAAPNVQRLAERADVAGARIAAWLGQYDFFAASADDEFRQRLMVRLVADARGLAAALPAEQLDGRALTAVKGLLAAAVALPDNTGFLNRALRVLPDEIARQVVSDGCHCERSPAQMLSALQDLTEIRALLQAVQAPPPVALAAAIEQMAPALRGLRHGDGGLALFNGTKDDTGSLVDLVLAKSGRTGRAPIALSEGGFHRLQAGKTVLIADCGEPAPPKLDRLAHAGTLSFELSVGRDRMIVNVGAAPAAGPEWRDATRATAAHSTLTIAETSSSELRPEGLGHRPDKVQVRHQVASGAHWLDASHNGYVRTFGAIHHRRLYLSESGDVVVGEDTVEAASPQPFMLRFHLHPDVKAVMQTDGQAVLLRLHSGAGWSLRANAARMTLEESIYLGGAQPRRSEQVVLTVFQDEPQQVKWEIAKIG